MDNNYKIEISHRTIIFAFALFFLLQFLWLIKDLIFSLFIAFIIMSALKPFVIFLVKTKVPRPVASVIVFFVFVSLVIYSIAFFIPPLIRESAQLFINLPNILYNLSPSISEVINIKALSQYLPDITSQVVNVVRIIFSNFVFTISTLFFSLYFLLDEDAIRTLLVRFFDEKQTEVVASVVNRVEKRMSAWFWGEVVLMIVVGVFTFVGLTLIGQRYVLSLSVLAGMLEIVPNLGPTLAAVPSVLVGFSQSSFLGIAALAVAILVQQLENNLIVPLVMKKAVGLNPIVTLIALIIGGRIGGALGVILAIPATLFLESLLIEIIKPKRE